MGTKKRLPVGIDSFEKLRKLGFYYVDKTGLIKELLDSWGEVNLFTRPRRFGKSLNMSMLKAFFEFGCDKSLFEGLQIEKEAEICERYMGRFPVIFFSLKGISGDSFDTSYMLLIKEIKREFKRFYFLAKSERLNDIDREEYLNALRMGYENGSVQKADLIDSIRLLSELLYRHYGKKVIILIDEYDVTLDKAHQFGYYEEMVNLIRNMFGQALKTNDSLYFAVLTGCLRISKESIFTGLNNMKILSIADVRFDEHFGFNNDEVLELLKYYSLEDRHEIVEKWYDGYHFGNADVYCPWDVLNYIDNAIEDAAAQPQAYWLNTSENNILRTFLQMATQNTMEEIDRLINGESIRKKITQELTYKELYDDLDNLWSVLFTTGYLTQLGKPSGDIFQLAIPNLEVKKIFVERIKEWFDEKVHEDSEKLDAFCKSFVKLDERAIEEQMNEYLGKAIVIL